MSTNEHSIPISSKVMQSQAVLLYHLFNQYAVRNSYGLLVVSLFGIRDLLRDLGLLEGVPSPLWPAYCREAILRADLDGDGGLSCAEFILWFCSEITAHVPVKNAEYMTSEVSPLYNTFVSVQTPVRESGFRKQAEGLTIAAMIRLISEYGLSHGGEDPELTRAIDIGTTRLFAERVKTQVEAATKLQYAQFVGLFILLAVEKGMPFDRLISPLMAPPLTTPDSPAGSEFSLPMEGLVTSLSGCTSAPKSTGRISISAALLAARNAMALSSANSASVSGGAVKGDGSGSPTMIKHVQIRPVGSANGKPTPGPYASFWGGSTLGKYSIPPSYSLDTTMNSRQHVLMGIQNAYIGGLIEQSVTSTVLECPNCNNPHTYSVMSDLRVMQSYFERLGFVNLPDVSYVTLRNLRAAFHRYCVRLNTCSLPSFKLREDVGTEIELKNCAELGSCVGCGTTPCTCCICHSRNLGLMDSHTFWRVCCDIPSLKALTAARIHSVFQMASSVAGIYAGEWPLGIHNTPMEPQPRDHPHSYSCDWMPCTSLYSSPYIVQEKVLNGSMSRPASALPPRSPTLYSDGPGARITSVSFSPDVGNGSEASRSRSRSGSSSGFDVERKSLQLRTLKALKPHEKTKSAKDDATGVVNVAVGLSGNKGGRPSSASVSSRNSVDTIGVPRTQPASTQRSASPSPNLCHSRSMPQLITATSGVLTPPRQPFVFTLPPGKNSPHAFAHVAPKPTLCFPQFLDAMRMLAEELVGHPVTQVAAEVALWRVLSELVYPGCPSKQQTNSRG